ncbi:MAG: hypothetical protein AYL32_005870 [Candidatus Bathyarchaeota archaeon B26-2]|nr:MAG: hypothetical protein AYL32_005870 [Candidatus Bathyarchaeota archaeon B26-2]
MKCEICGRRAESRFCELHKRAQENLREKYEEWKRAMDITWEEYLREVLKNPLTGLWVKEVARILLASSEEKEAPSMQEKV